MVTKVTPDKKVNNILSFVEVFLYKSSYIPPKKHKTELIPRIDHNINDVPSKNIRPKKKEIKTDKPPTLGVTEV